MEAPRILETRVVAPPPGGDPPAPGRSSLTWSRPAKAPFGLLEIYGAIGLLALLVARFVPLAKLPYWGCAMRRLTGLPCPTCGMTRSFDWLMQGRVLDSLAVNPLGFLLAVIAAAAGLYFVLSPLRLPRPRVTLTPRAARLLRIAVVAAVAFNWSYMIAGALAGRWG